MKILYGTVHSNIDVTAVCLSKLTTNHIVTIPEGDLNRSNFFTDPLFGVLKSIFVEIDGVSSSFHDNYTVKINILTNEIFLVSADKINHRMKEIHASLQLKYGSFDEELPEQKMVVRYLTGNEKVLEIGANIGRNSLVIAYLLREHENNFVTLECDPDIAKQLTENRELNHFNFCIEESALSKRKLIQQGWDTKPSEVLLDGYKWINTITLDVLKSKYVIDFDTLVLDCEGAFFYILTDTPQVLEGIKLIIMENDYHDITHKTYIDTVLVQNNFYRDYVEAGGWGPCYNNFFEVWKRNIG
jgi:FkbM family methyltransferase